MQVLGSIDPPLEGEKPQGGLLGLPPSVINLAFSCPADTAASGRIENGVPAWRYVYAGEFPNQDIGAEGAYHGAELAMVFGTSEHMSSKEDTEAQRKLGDIMRKAWTGFAKDPENALREMGWPEYDPKGKFLLRPSWGECSRSELDWM